MKVANTVTNTVTSSGITPKKMKLAKDVSKVINTADPKHASYIEFYILYFINSYN